MSIGKIRKMDVVANCGSVGSGIVGTKDGESFATGGGVKRQWNEVRLWFVVFANFAVGVGSRGIEIAQTIGMILIPAVETPDAAAQQA